MRKLAILVLCSILLSCSNQQKDPAKTNAAKDTAVTSVTAPLIQKPVFSILSFDKNATPLKDSIKGKIIDGASFKDAEGESIVLLTETENVYKGSTQNKSIYAYCFTKQGNSFKRKWLVQDKVDNCDVDATCEFLPGSLSVTDADSNQIAEATFLYQLSCKGDVSPHVKKLIMYHGQDKYAIRGTTILQTPAGKEGGDKKIDASFSKAPKPLFEFANKQWDKFGFAKY